MNTCRKFQDMSIFCFMKIYLVLCSSTGKTNLLLSTNLLSLVLLFSFCRLNIFPWLSVFLPFYSSYEFLFVASSNPISHCTKNEAFHKGFIQQMWLNLQLFADLVTFTGEILNRKLHFLCSEYYVIPTILLHIPLGKLNWLFILYYSLYPSTAELTCTSNVALLTYSVFNHLV